MVLNLETCHNDGNAKNTACGRRGARRFAFLPAKVGTSRTGRKQ